jgi:hypothetical protein
MSKPRFEPCTSRMPICRFSSRQVFSGSVINDDHSSIFKLPINSIIFKNKSINSAERYISCKCFASGLLVTDRIDFYCLRACVCVFIWRVMSSKMSDVRYLKKIRKFSRMFKRTYEIKIHQIYDNIMLQEIHFREYVLCFIFETWAIKISI